MTNLEMMDISRDLNDEFFDNTNVVLTPRSRASGKRKRNVDPEKRYKCTFCSKSYSSLHYFREHVLKHSSKENLRNCPQCDRTGFTDSGLRKHLKMVHSDRLKKEKTLNNNELPAIDNFAIFEQSKKFTYLNYDFVKAEIPRSPCSDDCSNFSVDSTVSTTSNNSNINEGNTFLYDQTSNAIFSTTSDSSHASDFSPVTDFYEDMHDVDEEILMILRSELEKNFVDVVLSFNEY